jgi:hypothetical protein
LLNDDGVGLFVLMNSRQGGRQAGKQPTGWYILVVHGTGAAMGEQTLGQKQG